MLRHITILLVIIITTVTGNSSTERCEDVGAQIIQKGCYCDPGGLNKNKNRTLPLMLTNGRDDIDWKEWDKFLDKFSCECARLAKEKNYRFFGLQYYGECWSGQHSEDLFKSKRSDKCISYDYKQCAVGSSETPCTGEHGYNYVYEIVYEETETNICEQLSPCQNQAECISSGDSYLCECLPGYTGQNCEEVIDPDDCAGSPCVNGECIDGVNSYQCKCNPGYEGENCETNINDCSGSPCVNGECIDGVNSYGCKCNPGYEGENCETNINDCSGSPCVNGECIDGVNSYQCKCNPGYEGRKCETNINECVGNKCVRGKCVDGVNSYHCKCDYGYEGNKCEQEVMKPSSCVNANWWSSFDKNGWSKCAKTNYFITGFYRSAPRKDEDPIYLLEEAKCCNAIPLLSSQAGECKKAEWGTSLDKNNRWSVCPDGYFLNGLERSQGIWNRDKLHRIENGHCCKPKNHPDLYGNCYDEDVGRSFDNQGWSGCSKTGYYITGVYRGNGADWLHNIAKFRCCQMTSAVTCETANWVHSFDKKGWSTCGKNNRFITGFYRSKQGSFWKDEIYRLENAKCCSASARYQGEDGRCVDQNWVRTLDNERTWATCPSGYFLSGLERSSGNDIHNIERGRCCRPKNHPAKYGACYDEDIKDEFDDAGWAVCGRGGYYVAGVYRNNGDKLHHIQKLRCCKMWA